MSFEQPIQEKPEPGGVEMPASKERLSEIAAEIGALHLDYDERVSSLDEEVSKLVSKPEYRGEKPWEFGKNMSPQDEKRHRELREEIENWKRRVVLLISESLRLIVKDTETEWRRIPSGGAPRSLTETNSRDYRATIGGGYELELSWANMPDHPAAANQPEAWFTEYSASIKGSRRVKRVLRKDQESRFPMVILQITFDYQGKNPEKRREWQYLDEQTQQEVERELIEQVEKLRSELG